MTLRSPQPKKLRYEDYLAFPEDGWRHEILAGEHVVSPSPLLYHQRVLGRLYVQLQAHIEERGLGQVFVAPTCVELGPHDVVEPDIVVLLADRAHLATRSQIVGAPSLLVEVLSPSNRNQDRIRKKARYAEHGVPEYWIVDPDAHLVEQWLLQGAAYRLEVTSGEALTLGGAVGVTIDLRRVW